MSVSYSELSFSDLCVKCIHKHTIYEIFKGVLFCGFFHVTCFKSSRSNCKGFEPFKPVQISFNFD